MTKINTIFWDFDGVIHDSNMVREFGFLKVLMHYPKHQVNELIKYHRTNGGLSRYVKFRYFYEVIRGEQLSEDMLQILCNQFSIIVKKLLKDKKLLIKATTSFIQKNYKNYNMHIVSGSDGNELLEICEYLDISRFFITINGSPTAKIKIVENLISQYEYDKSSCILIGDSINDWEAASINGIKFMAFNSSKEVKIKTNYILDISIDE